MDKYTERELKMIEALNEIEQILAQAIGRYPWYKDDQKNFPGSTEKDGVCVGEHVPETLAVEAANEIKRLRAALNAYTENRWNEMELRLAKLEAKEMSMWLIHGIEDPIDEIKSLRDRIAKLEAELELASTRSAD